MLQGTFILGKLCDSDYTMGKEKVSPSLPSSQSYWDATVPRRELLVWCKCTAYLFDDENKSLHDHFSRKLVLNS